MNILSTIKNIALDNEDSIAFQSGDVTLCYGDLWKQSESLATYLTTLKLPKKAPIIVYGHMSPKMVSSFLGVVKSGHPYIPVDVSIPKERIQKIIECSNAAFLIETEVLERDSLQQASIPSMSEGQLANILAEHTEGPTSSTWVKGHENFYIIYTSGSTGNPKGVQISAQNLESFVNWMHVDFPITNGGVFLNQAPFSFDLSVMDLYPALTTGATLFTISKEMIASPQALFMQLSQSKIGVWTSTPSFVQMCLMNPEFSSEMLPSLKTFLFCGEVLTREVASKLLKLFPSARIFNTYGPTEATVAVSAVEVTAELLNNYLSLPIGYIKNDTQMLIIDDEDRLLPDGEKGEMIIVGPSVSKGYLGEPNLTEKAFFEYEGQQAYRTGDIGYQKDGLHFYSGRADFQVKVHGYRMELEEIENHLLHCQYVDSCVVVPVFKNEAVDLLAAYIVPGEHSFEKNYQLSSAIKKELAKKLPAYMIPRKFNYCEQLPMTSNGKINRKQLVAEVMV
ncbi:D-alanine--poly(phosphoribitol) ligase subunit DltA [Viridibacillus sp. YIM B01967]|uniref:D-alanine--D-alanyl carrier protein ligase n=1 Tax=Viridibacillus soli TaxID=2798301 RepID=A0ABS1HC11_9BACL|nr:D-alanine--poly(phosphoribitol) ligase subunit DltA [Viridibacillus soli]MBK3496920.1 D-alanine--poly(phosphoribitol) ligase subunit DltA [Viridibacillus soli]